IHGILLLAITATFLNTRSKIISNIFHIIIFLVRWKHVDIYHVIKNHIWYTINAMKCLKIAIENGIWIRVEIGFYNFFFHLTLKDTRILQAQTAAASCFL
ncbi:hypothetical protein ACJX0J_026318, partial [Zea mays]